MPFCSANVGAHAIAVPCPPSRDTLPARMPIAGGRPSRVATATPSAFCSTMNTATATSRMTSGRPPALRSLTRALMPMVVKK